MSYEYKAKGGSDVTKDGHKMFRQDIVFDLNNYEGLRNKHEAEIAELEAENERLNGCAKRAFWWSAEFVDVVHNGKIQAAWEDYKIIMKLNEN